MENEEEIIHKRWFYTKPFIDKFAPNGYRSEQAARLANTLGLEYTRIRSMCEPGCMINAYTADRYAIKLGYHPANIWDDWFQLEPEGGSNPKVRQKKPRRQRPKASSHIVCTDTTQPSDYIQ